MPNDRRALKIDSLYREVHAVLEQARASAYRAVNTAMVQAYWHVGRLIVEHEQGGAKRAAYGEAVLEGLSRRLTTDFGRGFDPSNLRYMRLFFQNSRIVTRCATNCRRREFVTHRVTNRRDCVTSSHGRITGCYSGLKIRSRESGT